MFHKNGKNSFGGFEGWLSKTWLVAGLVFITATSASVAQSLTVSTSLSEAQQAAATTYWTRERIAAAPAMPMPVDYGSGTIDLKALEVSSGPFGATPSHAGDPDAEHIARSYFAEDWSVLDDPSEDEEESVDTPTKFQKGTSATYTSYDVNVNSAFWKILPHKWMGKLTFTTAQGSASCSATAISGNNIVTAAHCVYDTTNNVFYSNWAFSPGFRNGSAPYGVFTAKNCTVLSAWVNLTGSYSISSWARHDVAVCTMRPNSAGQTLNAAVGWAGRVWNANNKRLVFNSGYPVRTYTNALISSGAGQYLRSCTSETFLYTTETLGGGCNWGGGISGGSWLVSYKPFVSSGQVNSVNSGLFVNQQNIYGARFNSNNIVPLCTTRGC